MLVGLALKTGRLISLPRGPNSNRVAGTAITPLLFVAAVAVSYDTAD
jgi:hypothetical protein